MAAGYRPRRRRLPSCGSVMLAAAVGAAAVWVAIRAMVAWVASHPGAVAALVAAAALGGAGLSGLTARVAARRVQHINTVREFATLSPDDFEAAVADLCRRDGCTRVRVVGGAGDLAADVLATTPDGRRLLVQCKRYAVDRRVGSQDVQRVGGTYQVVHHADVALVVTTGGYTPAARDYARQAGIQLVDGGGLATWARGGRPPWA